MRSVWPLGFELNLSRASLLVEIATAVHDPDDNMDLDRLKSIRDRYPTSSWAIWSPNYPESGCVEENPDAMYRFFHQRIDKLTPNVVLLALNPSEGIPAPFANFHPTNELHYDYRLKEFIQENGLERLQGAFMTDLVLDQVDPESSKVTPTHEDVNPFLDQLDLLGETEYHIICFLEKVFQTLRGFFNAKVTELDHEIKRFKADWQGKTLHVYRVWFYGNWGANIDKVAKLESQLKYLNDDVLNLRESNP